MIIGFDADDTLWHNEDGFQASHREFEALLADYGDAQTIEDHLFEIETRNMPRYGYGVKAYTLSLIECAIDISDGRVSTAQIASILDLGHALLDRPVELIDGVEDVLDELEGHTKMIITKGDLYHQLSRIETSGLADRFWQTEVVAHKDVATYERVLGLHGVDPTNFVMVGNSLPSDILPVMALGGKGVHVPYHVTWTHERHDGDHDAPVIDHLGELPAVLSDLGAI
ncbi:MAG: HAD family hydrolase [Actinomycetota bacterium]